MAPLGIMRIGDGGFEAAYRSVVDDSAGRRTAPAGSAIAARMMGSAQGWLEAPYCRGTAGARELAGRLGKVFFSDGRDAPSGAGCFADRAAGRSHVWPVLRQLSICGRRAGIGEAKAKATERRGTAFDAGVDAARASGGGISP
ncbi:2-dehydro-3-deoxygalactonokinase [Cupriavidus pauculus]|uniref:2-dehydro-3-deoxygalactonokinase n=1 Tax=Cupriavidus pauculus TaxID=82633 RepID=UPI0024B4A0C5|nr:2-dehydro-3-deoxygalactonokinase [Cupriavidus pauculus]